MDSKILGYVLNGLKFLVAIFGIILFVLIVSGETNEELNGPVSNALSLSQYVVYACAITILGFGIYHVARDVKKNIPILIGIALFCIILFIGYSMADGSEMTVVNGPNVELITSTVSKWSGAGLKMLYVLLGITLLVSLFSEVKKLIR